ncbi:MAG: HPr-rel-A system PqqD family peptide chaperone [Alphaproteobacteria bacterium]|nr:HPr-rel-A system PqqD family peptide chaperone [Alphaproteobacteria bacterium]
MTASAQLRTKAETWRIAAEVRWRIWDGEVVAYNGRSGHTHHFADFAGWVFAHLAAQPASADGLTQAAANDVELRSGAAPSATVERTLGLLRRLDLIERAP